MTCPRSWSGTGTVVRGHRVVREESSGRVSGPDSPPCRPGTRFQAGSISKLVLSVAVLELAARGELRLHAPVTDWLTEAPRQWDRLTLHRLLSHTSGLGHWGDVPGLPPVLGDPPPRDELIAMITRADLVLPPGAGWRYSGPGFVVAALVIEAATRRPYGDTVADLVLEPAGLASTTSGVCPAGEQDVAGGHRRGEPAEVHPGFSDIPGTGDLWTTTADLVRLNQALRRGDVLAPAMAARLWTPHADIGGSDDGGPLVMDAYGYGTFLGRLNGRPARIHPGDNPGYQSLLAYWPDDDTDVAVLCNDDEGRNAALADLTGR